jgi:biotin transporter BioY
VVPRIAAVPLSARCRVRYIVGLFAAAACRYLAERGVDRSVRGSVPAMIAGEIIIYAFGMTWLALDLHLGAGATLNGRRLTAHTPESHRCQLAAVDHQVRSVNE